MGSETKLEGKETGRESHREPCRCSRLLLSASLGIRAEGLESSSGRAAKSCLPSLWDPGGLGTRQIRVMDSSES
ncbi:hypothetical protein NDU88_003868 [Pleurodeles waltl]|uniref:Uncharacterized protein n=1 Tax=Pleurodeles waltl TaxID=8319 RepID=A0AAV7UGH6_PLEWA|nr:hypothetical protein NDU88_003868 [Pleurodeles waltl]